MEQSITVEIDAPIVTVWAVLSDAENWPSWAQTVTTVTVEGGGPLQVGSRATIKQPRIPKTVWTVTELVPGRSFTWTTKGPGVVGVARHELTERPEGGTRARLAVEQTGWLGGPIGRLYAGLTDRYLAMEAAGLRRRSEAAASSDFGR
jgi:uncharacterized protein YndB with AHSA1/START domain